MANQNEDRVRMDEDGEKTRWHANNAQHSAELAAQASKSALDHTAKAQNARNTALYAGEAAVRARNEAEWAKNDAERALREVEVELEAKASASGSGSAPLAMPSPRFPTPPAMPGKPADEIVASMGQLSTLLIGTSPAFAHAIRLQTDAVATGMSGLNAVANQQSHYTLDLAATARALTEAYTGARGDTNFNVNVPPPESK